jgi:hypothetical protein
VICLNENLGLCLFLSSASAITLDLKFMHLARCLQSIATRNVAALEESITVIDEASRGARNHDT